MATRVVWKFKAMAQLLDDPAIAADLERRARAIASTADAAAGDGARHRVELEADVGKRSTPRAAVVTDNTPARVAEATRHTLTSALDAGRR